jgi:hypothetical protein
VHMIAMEPNAEVLKVVCAQTGNKVTDANFTIAGSSTVLYITKLRSESQDPCALLATTLKALVEVELRLSHAIRKADSHGKQCSLYPGAIHKGRGEKNKKNKILPITQQFIQGFQEAGEECGIAVVQIMHWTGTCLHQNASE